MIALARLMARPSGIRPFEPPPPTRGAWESRPARATPGDEDRRDSSEAKAVRAASGVRYGSVERPTLAAQDAGRVEAEGHLLEIDGAADQQRRARQDDDYHGGLSGDERLAEPGHERAGHRALPVAEILAQVAGRRRPRGQKAHDHRAGHGQQQGDGDDRAVQRRLTEPRHPFRSGGEQQRQQPPRGDDTRHAAGQRQHEALRQHLPDDAPAAGAECRPNRELPRTDRKARQQQVGGVAAGDDQHRRDREQEDEQPQPEISDDELVQALAAGTAIFVLVGMVAHQPFGEAGELVVHLCERDVGAPPAVHLEVVLVVHDQAFRCERDGDDDIGTICDGVERGGHHPDDRVRHIVQKQRLPERVGPSTEAAGPQAVPEHRHLLSPRRVLVGGERAAKRRRHPEDVEPAGRRSKADDALGLRVAGQVEAGKRRCRQRLQRRDALTHVVEVADRRAAWPAPPRGVDRQHALRLGVRERREDDRVHDAEDGGGRTQPDRQRQDDAEREAGPLARLPQRDAHVEDQVRQPLPAVARSVALVSERVERPGHRGRVAEPPLRLGAGRLRRHAARDELFGPQVEMMRQLFAHFLFDWHPPQPRTQMTPQHGYTLTSTRVTAEANACQAAVSLVSCWRPARVSR